MTKDNRLQELADRMDRLAEQMKTVKLTDADHEKALELVDKLEEPITKLEKLE